MKAYVLAEACVSAGGKVDWVKAEAYSTLEKAEKRLAARCVSAARDPGKEILHYNGEKNELGVIEGGFVKEIRLTECEIE